jgi:ribosomal protein L11 methyltransferase
VLYPALDVAGADSEFVLAVVDGFSPAAVEEHEQDLTIFFADASSRDRAHDALKDAFPSARCTARDVDDGDWARRSQENLTAVTVGRVTIAPPWATSAAMRNAPLMPAQDTDPLEMVIEPSMGFGTGHHATTRLCLAALQRIDLTNRICLDVGTGSGVLALAACLLGARQALGIDFDPDAIQNARDNAAFNPHIRGVSFEVRDLRDPGHAAAFDVVTANLTGALLVAAREILLAAVRPGGHLVLSGVLADERNDVQDAFSALRLEHADEDEGWVGFQFEK